MRTPFHTQNYTHMHEFKPHHTLSQLSVTHTHAVHGHTHAVIYRRPPVRLSKKEGRKSHIGCGLLAFLSTGSVLNESSVRFYSAPVRRFTIPSTMTSV